MTRPPDAAQGSDPRDALFDVSHLQKDLGARTGRSAVTVLLFSAFKLVLALGTTAVLARLIPPAEHGLLALAIPAVLIAAGLSEFGLAQAVTQRREVTHRLASALFWVNVALGASLAALVFAAGSWAADFYDTPEVTAIFRILSPYVFLAVLTTQYMALLRRQMRVAVIERCNTGATIVSALVAIGMAWAGYGVEALVTQLLLVQGLTFVFLVWATGWVPSGPGSLRGQPLREVLSYGGFLAAERVLNDLSRNIQLTVIGRLFGTVDAGLYYRADTIAQMPQRRVLSPLSAAFIPALSRLQDDAVALRAMLRRQISRSNLIVVPLGAVLTGLADVFVRILLGPDWMEATPILALFGVFVATAAAQSCMAWTLVSVGASRALFLFRLINTPMILACVLVAASLGFDVVGVTAAYVGAAAIFGVLHLSFWVMRASPIGRPDILACLGDTFAMALVLIGAAAGMRWLLDLSIWAEGGLTLALIIGLTLARGLGRADTRADILKLARRGR
jgi:PST family polysaccharide transporter